MKGVLLGWFGGLVVPVQSIFVLPLQLWSAQYKILFSSPDSFSLYPHHPATWAGRIAGSPVYVAPISAVIRTQVQGIRLLICDGSDYRFNGDF